MNGPHHRCLAEAVAGLVDAPARRRARRGDGPPRERRAVPHPAVRRRARRRRCARRRARSERPWRASLDLDRDAGREATERELARRGVPARRRLPRGGSLPLMEHLEPLLRRRGARPRARPGDAGPVLLVGNHSGGLAHARHERLLRRLVPRARAREPAHRPRLRRARSASRGSATSCGRSARSRRAGENAARALDAGLPVLVYPGGDHECFRPWTDRNRIDFDGRKGFVELALRKRVPVVPVVSHGGHHSTCILTRGDWLGRLFGTERIRTTTFPIGAADPVGALADRSSRASRCPAKITIADRSADALVAVRARRGRRPRDRRALLPRDHGAHAGDARPARRGAPVPGARRGCGGLPCRQEMTMERLTGIDASFLYMETPTLHMHTIKVAVLEPAPGRRLLDRAREGRSPGAAAPPAAVPPPRGRGPARLPSSGVDRGPGFDLDHHVRRDDRAGAGRTARDGRRRSRTSRASPLDRRRPLWELWLARGARRRPRRRRGEDPSRRRRRRRRRGAPGERHGARRCTASPSPEPAHAVAARGRAVGRAAPARCARATTCGSSARLPGAPPAHGAEPGRRRAAPAGGDASSPPLPMRDAPRTSLNGSLTARRAFVSTALSLADVRRVRDALRRDAERRAAGARRGRRCARYLGGAASALPARPLVAEVPVATDAPGRAAARRQPALEHLHLALHRRRRSGDAAAEAIHDVTQAAKELHELLGPDLFESWIAVRAAAPALVVDAALRRGSASPTGIAPPVNVIVSCVPGPRTSLAWPGGTARGDLLRRPDHRGRRAST